MIINNPIIWTLTDGSDGMISQVKGLALEFGKNITEIKTDLIFPWNKLPPGIIPTFRWIFKNKLPSNIIPNVVISCGRKSVFLSTYLKKNFPHIVNIHIQNPKISSNYFTFLVVPSHDNLIGENVINSVGAIHHLKKNNIIFNDIDIQKSNLISCIIGGENNHYYFNEKQAYDLCRKIKNIKISNPSFNILIITSRRTNSKIKSILKKHLGSISKLWLGDGNNPYLFAIQNSNFFIITSDSTSMISEASISEKPIYIYQLPFKRKSNRFERFHHEFKKLKITRDFNNTEILENWSYDSLNESERIAGIIKKRIIEGSNETK